MLMSVAARESRAAMIAATRCASRAVAAAVTCASSEYAHCRTRTVPLAVFVLAAAGTCSGNLAQQKIDTKLVRYALQKA